MERPAARASGVTTYGVALAVGLVVAAGGLGFAAGRMTADEASTGAGGSPPLRPEARLAVGSGALPDAGLGSGAASTKA